MPHSNRINMTETHLLHLIATPLLFECRLYVCTYIYTEIPEPRAINFSFQIPKLHNIFRLLSLYLCLLVLFFFPNFSFKLSLFKERKRNVIWKLACCLLLSSIPSSSIAISSIKSLNQDKVCLKSVRSKIIVTNNKDTKNCNYYERAAAI